MLEYEKKIMLTAEEYYTILIQLCKHKKIESQTNYYFDNDELSMNENGITWRVRAKNGKYKATVKNHNVDNPDCSVEVDLMEKAEFDSQIFSVFGLRHRGELVTERVVMHKDSTCEMVLDKNIYLGHTDYELEIEYCKDSDQKAILLIKNIAESLVENKHLNKTDEFMERIGKGSSKSQRFFERLKNF